MAINAASVFEIRTTATAANVNGGFFVTGASGSDYSQQDAAQYTFTDLVIGADNTTMTSALVPFTSDMVGNGLRVNTGTNFTKTWYEIVSVAGGVAQLDKAAGTAGSTAGGGKVGGALSLASSDDAVFELAVAGTTYYVKTGTYVLGGTVNIAAAGTVLKTNKIIGYTSARNDATVGTNRPTFDLTAAGFTLGDYWRMNNIQLTTTGGVTALTTGQRNIVVNCKITDKATSAQTAVSMSNYSQIIDCEIICYRGTCLAGGNTHSVTNSYIHDCLIGIKNTGAGGSSDCNYSGNLFSGCVTAAIQFSAGNTLLMAISKNTIYGAENKLGIGLSLSTGTGVSSFTNNIVYGCVTGVSDADTGYNDSYDDFNCYNNNTTDVTNWVKGPSDIATNPTFTSVAQVTGTTATTAAGVLTDNSADFSNVVAGRDFIYIISGTGVTAGVYGITAATLHTVTPDLAPGNNATGDKVYQITTGRNWAVGTNMKAMGSPGLFQGGVTTAATDIGAIQRVEPTSTDPGVGNVKSGVGYTINDASLTGTLLSTDPGVANVVSGVNYSINSASLTGTGANIPAGGGGGVTDVGGSLT